MNSLCRGIFPSSFLLVFRFLSQTIAVLSSSFHYLINIMELFIRLLPNDYVRTFQTSISIDVSLPANDHRASLLLGFVSTSKEIRNIFYFESPSRHIAIPSETVAGRLPVARFDVYPPFNRYIVVYVLSVVQHIV